MKFVINEKKEPKILFYWDYIGQGGEAKVYRKNDLAYKYYRFFDYSERLSLEDVQMLEKLHTSRILLPQNILYTVFGKFKGYTTRYVSNLGLIHFMMLPREVIFHNFSLLKEDSRILGEKQIAISDLLPRDYSVCNHSFNHGLYFVDPGKFYKNEKLSPEDVTLRNERAIDNFLYFRVFSLYANEAIGKYHYDYANLQKIKDQAYQQNLSFMDFIQRDMHEDNLSSYVKRKIL